MALNIQSGLNLSGLSGANPYANLTGNAQGDLAALGANYGQQQKASVDLNSQLYNNVMGGYSSVLQNHQQQAAGIAGGYGQLSSDVLGRIQGIDASQRQAIQDAYQQQQGAAQQNLQSRGLANSTVVDSTNRGLMLDKQKADVALSNATAGLQAGYQSQLGLAGLGFQGQALQQQTGIGLGQIGSMERVNAGYPQAQAYQSIAQMIGANRQADQNRQLAMQGLAMQRPMPTGGGVQPGGGQGFFGSNPYAYTGGGQVSPPPFSSGVPQRPLPGFGPPPGTTLDAHPDAFAAAQAYGGGYGDAALGGAGAALAMGQGGPPLAYPGEGDQGLGALAGGAAGYSQYLPQQQGAGYQSGNYGYGGGDLNNGTQSTADFYFGGDY